MAQQDPVAIMAVRSWKERAIQTLAYEAGGIALAVPLYSQIFDQTFAESLVLMASLSAVFLLWFPLFNSIWDHIEWRRFGRLASSRPKGWRILHAVALEGSDTLLSLPLLTFLGGHGLGEAILIDLCLTALFAGYAFAFHMGFDWLRPVRPGLSTRHASA